MIEEKTRELMRFAIANASHCFERDGRVMPVWLAASGDKMDIIGAPWSSYEEKRTAMQAVRMFFEATRPERYAFIAESWMLAPPLGTKREDINMKKSIAEHPDRIEVVMVSGEDRNGSAMVYRKIERPREGDPVLGPEEWIDMGASEGPAAGLLRRDA